MIIRLSQKLAKKLKVGTLGSLPLDPDPYADWSAHVFTADRTQYIILTNTRSLYSVVMFGRGIADDSRFIKRALDNIREFMEVDGQAFVFQRFLVPASGRVRFAKSLNRSVIGSINELIAYAKHWLVEGELSPFDVGFKLNEIPMSAIGDGTRDRYGIPRKAFKLLADDCGSADGGEELPEAGASGQAPGDDQTGVVTSECGASPSADRTINVSFTCAQRRAIAEICPQLAGHLRLDEKNARKISFTSGEIDTIRREAECAIPHARNGAKRNSLCHVVRASTKAIEASQGCGSIPASERLYQFKITLIESEPPIWRRIQVKNESLDKLHEYIQTAMGWTNSHLHQFEIRDRIYGDPELLCDGWQDEAATVNSRTTRISDVVPRDGKRFCFQYEYDFGDRWRHDVLFEGCLRADKGERYPLCLEGERACPPEDVGSLDGYAEFLEALADPTHEQHEEFMAWGGPFDPEQFDARTATRAMRLGLPDWRLHE